MEELGCLPQLAMHHTDHMVSNWDRKAMASTRGRSELGCLQDLGCIEDLGCTLELASTLGTGALTLGRGASTLALGRVSRAAGSPQQMGSHHRAPYIQERRTLDQARARVKARARAQGRARARAQGRAQARERVPARERVQQRGCQGRETGRAQAWDWGMALGWGCRWARAQGRQWLAPGQCCLSLRPHPGVPPSACTCRRCQGFHPASWPCGNTRPLPSHPSCSAGGRAAQHGLYIALSWGRSGRRRSRTR